VSPLYYFEEGLVAPVAFLGYCGHVKLLFGEDVGSRGIPRLAAANANIGSVNPSMARWQLKNPP
jgi:hypothetical protein